jgi:type IV pilus assembly protein PilE
VNRTRQKGFTLIEVMIVVVIVGVLLMVALPAYQSSLQKGRRADGMAALMDAAGRQERFMLDRSTYTPDMEELGYAADPYISPEQHYSIDATDCDGGEDEEKLKTCYQLTAEPAAGSVQLKDTRCTSFVLNSNGTKAATGSIASECW